MKICFPCQKVTILENIIYFQISLTTNSFQKSCAPILFFKNLKNSHLSRISNFHALNEILQKHMVPHSTQNPISKEQSIEVFQRHIYHPHSFPGSKRTKFETFMVYSISRHIPKYEFFLEKSAKNFKLHNIVKTHSGIQKMCSTRRWKA